MKVLKFGGSSVGTPESLANVKHIVEASTANDNVLDNFDQIIQSFSAEKKITIHIL